MKLKTIKPYIPYSGCKQRISESIIKVIKEKHPHKDVAIDLFGGGGSMSFQFLASGYKKVIYNELNIGYYSLIKFLKNRREVCLSNKLPLTLPDYFYRFVDKESYSNIKLQNNNFLSLEQITYKYYVLSCYTFNNLSDKSKNDKSGYLYAQTRINANYYIHQVLVFKDTFALQQIKKYFSILGNIVNLLDCCLNNNLQKAIYDFNRYISIITFLFDNVNRTPKCSPIILRLNEEYEKDKNYFENHSQRELCELFLLYGLQLKLNRLSCGEFVKGVFSCDHLSRILHIQAILQLPLEKLECYNMSYDNFAITENNCIVYCFDKETEVLTNNGWKSFKDVDIKNDLFLSRQPNTNIIEYKRATHYINREYNGKMYLYESRSQNICVSPEHNMFVERKRGRKKISCQEFIKAQDLFGKTGYSFITAGCVNNNIDNSNIEIEGDIFNKKDFAYLLGLFLTDGCINNQDIITITQSKPQIKQKLINILNKLNIKYSVYNDKCFHLPRKYKTYFKQFYLKENRHIPKDFLNSSRDIMMSLLEGIIDGDGDLSTRRKIWLGSKNLVDDIMELCYKIGLSATYSMRQPKTQYYKKENRYIIATKPYYTIYINHNVCHTKMNTDEKYIDYKGNIYCVVLEDWHTILTRRNGKTQWMGQCDPPYYNTQGYNADTFDFARFSGWCYNCKHPLFVSEITNPNPNKLVSIWQHKIKDNVSKNTLRLEQLFWNGK